MENWWVAIALAKGKILGMLMLAHRAVWTLLSLWLVGGALSCLGSAQAAESVPGESSLLQWVSPALGQLEGERQRLDARLQSLPAAPTPHVTERLGWHSHYSDSPDAIEWIDLTFDRPERVDAVVLIAPPPGAAVTEPGYGFPKRFRVEFWAEPDEEAQRTIIAEYTQEDFPNPGNLPVYLDAGGKLASRVRITGTKLYREGSRSLFALGEVMLLQGRRNLGAVLEVTGPSAVKGSSSQGTRPDWGRINLVDGHTVLGPPLGTKASPTLGFHSKPWSESRGGPAPWVSVDLEEAVPVEEICLFPAHPPQFAHSHGYGFPVRYELELREAAEAEAETLAEPQSGSYSASPGDNVATVVGQGVLARHVRLRVLEPHVSNGSALLALAEMQVWSGGKNVALGKTVTSLDSKEAEGWSRASLVDGYSSLADIVEWPGWLKGLSERREILRELAHIQERRTAVLMQWRQAGVVVLIVVVLGVMAFTIQWYLRQRRARRQELEALRQRISQDLHDEIGSSLGSIALISQDALALAQDDNVRRDLGEIRDTAVQTLDSMRDIVRLAQTGVYGQGDLTAHLREIAGRMLRGVPHTIQGEADAAFNELPMNQRRDLVLMFKETLHNLSRHAHATQAEIKLEQGPDAVTLLVKDNGCGFEPASTNGTGMGLTNLQRRATKHGGRVDIHSAPTKGTSIHIIFPRHG